MSESPPAAILKATTEDLDFLISHLQWAISKAFLIDQQRMGHTKVRAYKALFNVLYAIMEDSGLSKEEIAMAIDTNIDDLCAHIDKH